MKSEEMGDLTFYRHSSYSTGIKRITLTSRICRPLPDEFAQDFRIFVFGFFTIQSYALLTDLSYYPFKRFEKVWKRVHCRL